MTSVSFEAGGGRGGGTESWIAYRPGSGAVIIGTIPVTPGHGGPANTAKPSDRSGVSGGQGGGSSDPAFAGVGGNAGCSALAFNDGSMECGTPSITGGNGGHGSAGSLGGAGGMAGGSTTSSGGRGLGAKNLGGNGGSGGGGVNGGSAGGGAKGISAGGGGGAGTSYVDDSVQAWQISAMDYNCSSPGI